jgi:hypothetical protein
MTAIKRVLQGAQTSIFQLRNRTKNFVSNADYFSVEKRDVTIIWTYELGNGD